MVDHHGEEPRHIFQEYVKSIAWLLATVKLLHAAIFIRPTSAKKGAIPGWFWPEHSKSQIIGTLLYFLYLYLLAPLIQHIDWSKTNINWIALSEVM
jgi:hypothetical protein